MSVATIETYAKLGMLVIHGRSDNGLVVEARATCFPCRFSVYRRVRPGFVVLDVDTHDASEAWSAWHSINRVA
jgi:hypothetical protein